MRKQDELRTQDMAKLHDQDTAQKKERLKTPMHPALWGPLLKLSKVKSGPGRCGHGAE